MTTALKSWHRLVVIVVAVVASMFMVGAGTANAADTDPRITARYYVLSTLGYPVSETFEATGGTGPLTFSHRDALPAGLSMNSAGLVTGTPTRVGTYQVFVEVTDAAGRSDLSVVVWQVARPLTFVGLRNLIAFVGRDRTEQLEITNPENVPVTFSAVGLPAGLRLDATSGRITGRPTTAGTFESVVTLRGPAGQTDSATLTWTVHATPVLTDPGPQVSTVGQPVRLPIEVRHNGNPLRFDAFGLPYGLDIDGTTGVITGTSPWASDTDTVNVSVYDTSTGARAEVSFTWQVVESPQGR